MSQRMRDLAPFQKCHQLENVRSQFLYSLVLLRRDVVANNMRLTGVVGKVGRILATDEGIPMMGDCQATVYGIVVRNRYCIHTSSFGDSVNLFRRGVAFLGSQLSQNPFIWMFT